LSTADWFAEVNAQGVRRVAFALGLTVHERFTHGVGPCPACGAEKRHPRHGDKRLAIGLRPDCQGWRCHECDEHGDPVALAALVVTGKTKPSAPPEWADVRRRCAAEGLCDPDPHDGAPLPPKRKRQTPPPPPPLELQRAPSHEVAALWSACRPVTDDPEVAAWLASRGLSPSEIELRDLARALPADIALPEWALGPGGDWRRSGRRCILPMFDVNGALVSLRARAVRDVEGPKALAPAGYAVAGLVLADILGRQFLTGSRPAALVARASGVVIEEGEPAFLAGASVFPGTDAAAPMVLGIVSGSWTPALAARIPYGTRVTIDTDHDTPGDKYAETIAATLENRCPLHRTVG
jgi:hypothetical protein